MDNLSIFDFETHPIRILLLDDAPYWIATDLSSILGYRNAPDMVRMLDEDQAATHPVRSSSQTREMLVVTEGGMWTCVLRSKRPEAKRFVRWLTDVLLPTLRRTGSYTMPAHEEAPSPPDQASAIDMPRLNTALAVVREARRLFGPATARYIWAELGLPLPGSNRLGHADQDVADEELGSAIAAWVRGKDRFTTAELMAGLGFNPGNAALKTRIHALMRGAGWIYKKTYRRNAPNILTWHCPYVDLAMDAAAAGESMQ